MSKELKDYVTTIPDFPKPGIMFRDITTVVQDPEGLKLAVDGMVDLLKDVDYDLVAGTESRGFVFGVPLAYLTGRGFLMIRKKGKLPRKTVSQKYELEYGEAEIEINEDAVHRRQRGSSREAGGKAWRKSCQNPFRDGTGRTGRTRKTEGIRRGVPDRLRGEMNGMFSF